MVQAIVRAHTRKQTGRFGRKRENRGKSGPEDGNSMFLQNVGIYLQVHMVSQSRITTSITAYWCGTFQQYISLVVPDW
jgi:hypothetical protein